MRQVPEYEGGHIPGALNITPYTNCSTESTRVVLVDDVFHNADNINFAA